MNLGPLEIGLIIIAVMLLAGYKQLPKAARSLGQSLHILKSELGENSKAPDPEIDPQRSTS